MTVRIVKLESELAVPELARKLTEAGLALDYKTKRSKGVSVSLNDGDEQLLTDTLSQAFMSDWMYAYIGDRLHEWHPYLTDDEREYVALLTLHGLRTSPTPEYGCDDWTTEIHRQLDEMFRDSGLSYLQMDGFMRFRAKRLLHAADVGIGEVVEQFLADREYEEFVSLLRYMLEAQRPTQQVVHLFCTDERLWMCDNDGLLVADDDVTRAAHQVSDDGDVNAEDLAMSVLITRSPCKIVIHDTTHGAAWPSFSETVERVFLERAVRCNDCAACTRLEHGESLPPVETMRLWATGNSME